MRTFSGLTFFVFMLAVAVLGATETTSPDLQRDRQTSTLSEISVKPLFLFSARGRRDPFMFDFTMDNTSATASEDFSISTLTLVGFIGEGIAREALFVDTWQNTTYKFRGGHLYNPEGVLITNVAGSFKDESHVSLNQGDSDIVFNMPENSRISSLRLKRDHNGRRDNDEQGDPDDHNRKEPQQ